MKKLNKKKGFTIVELVIVIAVVGVLTAVLVPTFVNLTNQARKAENQTFVKNLNTQMAIREATEGKNKTMYEAMMEAEDIGYNVEKLTPYDGNDIVWDSVANRFAIVGSDYATKKTVVYADGEIKATSIHQLWKIYAEMPKTTQTYSIYAKEGWKVKNVKNLKVGFDAGKNEGINAVEYGETSMPSTFAYSKSGRKGPRFANEEVGKDVVIRTNGGTLTVNAPADTLRHYGKADSINIEKIAATSYHEYGEVGYAKIANGRLVVNESAQIEGIYLVANQFGEFEGIKLAVVGNTELPSIARADVDLADGQSKLVVEIQTLATSDAVDANPEYVWISKTGTGVSTNVSSSSTDANATVTKPSAAAEVVKEDAKESASPVSDNSVARIGGVGYEDLGLAFVNVKADKSIVLLKDIDTTHCFLYKHDFAATFDLNGFTLRTYGCQDSADNETFGYAAGGRSVRVYNGNLTIKNGVLDGRNYIVEDDLFTLDPKTSNSWGVNNVGGCVRIESGTVTLTGLTLYNNDGWGTAVSIRSKDGHVKMNNCEIHSVYGSCIDVYGDSEIRNCKFYQHFIQTNTSSAWLATCIGMGYGATCNVYDSSAGGVVENEDIEFTEGTGVDALSVFSSGGTLNVYGGSFTASRYVVHLWPDSSKVNPSVVNIYSGEFNGEIHFEQDPNNLCSLNVYGGTFSEDVSEYTK